MGVTAGAPCIERADKRLDAHAPDQKRAECRSPKGGGTATTDDAPSSPVFKLTAQNLRRHNKAMRATEDLLPIHFRQSLKTGVLRKPIDEKLVAVTGMDHAVPSPRGTWPMVHLIVHGPGGMTIEMLVDGNCTIASSKRLVQDREPSAREHLQRWLVHEGVDGPPIAVKDSEVLGDLAATTVYSVAYLRGSGHEPDADYGGARHVTVDMSIAIESEDWMGQRMDDSTVASATLMKEMKSSRLSRGSPQSMAGA